MMPANETDAQRWARRVTSAVASAITGGADPESVRAAVDAGIQEGQRINDLRNGTHVPATEPTKPFVPQPGSAAEKLLRAVGSI
ncbi:hypothetical protein [Micromonospora sp. NPDC049204]|uniref:hypothetical protein n=1 Tax=Micromonospora sp. NPDC049204 TaxID=3154351 RepID=UPI0033C5D48D